MVINNEFQALHTSVEVRYCRGNAGEGAYSVVYRVQRIEDGQVYALKKVKLPHLSEKEK